MQTPSYKDYRKTSATIPARKGEARAKLEDYPKI